jgi:uncharacterized protein
MPGPAVLLKELHRLRQHIKDLETRIEEGPRKLTVQQKRLANQEDALKSAQEYLKNLALQIREKEGSVKATQQQIKKYEKQFDEAANKKEYDTLKTEINQERDHISKHEDEILAAMTEQDEKTAHLPEVVKATEKARADFAQFEKDLAERLQRFADEKTRTLVELKATEATLPEDVRPQYERMIAGKGIDALAGLQGRICSACYTEITSQMLSELKREMFILCKNCGRMLYIES